MSYQVLSRKWRPKNFSDVIGQPHIVRSLQQAILRNKVGHAYIFAGTRGVGKTSLARIFAKALRCEHRLPDGNPCCQCSNCKDIDNSTSFDVLELDGASNNKVENVRDLIDGVGFLPTTGSKKIYILDEVHMLSNSAFNALLKTLEEPPDHVVFILATTEPDKLLGTVLSRCQRFDFRNASLQDLISHIENIAKSENFSFRPSSLLERVCEQGQGSVRDTLSLLDQVLSYCPERVITEDILVSSLGLIRLSSLRALTEMMIDGKVDELSNLYASLLSENADIKKLAISLLNHLFSIIQATHKKSPTIYELITKNTLQSLQMSELYWIYETLSKDFSWALISHNPLHTTILVMQKIALRRTFFEVGQARVVAQPTQKTSEETAIPEEEEPEPQVASDIADIPMEAEIVLESEPTHSTQKTWDDFLAYLFSSSPAMASNLEQGNLAKPLTFEGNTLVFELAFTESGRIFYDYLQTPEVFQKIKLQIASFFNCQLEHISLTLTLFKRAQEEDRQFLSKADEKAIKEKEIQAEKERQIAEDPMIKEVEKIFKAKIDKIVLNKS